MYLCIFCLCMIKCTLPRIQCSSAASVVYYNYRNLWLRKTKSVKISKWSIDESIDKWPVATSVHSVVIFGPLWKQISIILSKVFPWTFLINCRILMKFQVECMPQRLYGRVRTLGRVDQVEMAQINNNIHCTWLWTPEAISFQWLKNLKNIKIFCFIPLVSRQHQQM